MRKHTSSRGTRVGPVPRDLPSGRIPRRVRNVALLSISGALTLALILSAAGALPADRPSYTVVVTKADREALLAADESAWATVGTIVWGPAAYHTRFRATWSGEGLYLHVTQPAC